MFVSLSIMLCGVAQADEAKKPINLVKNGGFEEEGSWPFIPSGAVSEGKIVAGIAHSGRHSFWMTNKSAFAPNVYARIVQPQSGLRPFTTYRISCWVKGEDVGIDWIGGGPGWTQRFHFPKGTYDWTEVSAETTTGPD
ncbi:MAG TPA: carbohydrate binding domain-containing protein, partial [Tepidisphaeraceae bacterium]|nr:carbohydrate binding domain-containing protein [Tepidisphaeraceae bacterium]